MKFINGAVVMTDVETGKPYSRFLSPLELNLVLAQLQALDGGTLNAREVAPFIIRTPGVTEDEARELIETEQAQSVLDRLVGKRVTVQITPAAGTFKHSGTHQGGTMRVPTLPENLPPEWKPAPQCWNCAQPHYIEQVRENDGNCPTCGHQWAEDDA